MKFLLVTCDSGEEILIKADVARGVREVDVFPVPGAQGDFTGVCIFEDRIVPVKGDFSKGEKTSCVVVLESGGDVFAYALKGPPEMMEVDIDSAYRFAEDHGIKLLIE